jgi:hypothetical protein
VSNLPAFDTYAFGGRGSHPVHAEYDGHEFTSTGVAFEDYARMHVEQRKLGANRTAPAWAFNADKLRRVIVRTMEVRAGLRNPQPGTDAERMAHAQQKLDDSRRLLTATIDRLCEEFVAAKKAGDVARTEFLARKIKEQDTRLAVIPNAAMLYAGVSYHVWRCGLDSVAAAQNLGLKPPLVRQTLARMCAIAHELGYGPAPRIGKKWGNKDPQRKVARQFADLIKRMTWEDAKAEMGQPDTHNGKFRRLLKKFGYWKPRTGPRQFVSDVRKIADERAQGMSYVTIANKHGVSPKTVQRVLREHHRDIAAPKQSLHRGRIDKTEAVTLHGQGWSSARIARHYGVHLTAAYYVLKRAGVYKPTPRQRASDGTFKAPNSGVLE